MNGMQSGLNAAIIFIALFIFGWWFNRRIEKIGVDGDGFVWLMVVIGTSVTLVGIGLLDLTLDWNAGLIGFAAFACSGLFMVGGDVQRYISRRRRMKEMAQNDAPKTLAE